VNKAKSNYTKALQRLEELNRKIYDNSNKLFSNGEFLPASETNPPSIGSSSDNGESPTEKASPGKCASSNIFDNQLLDQLILEDNIESVLEQLKAECLS